MLKVCVVTLVTWTPIFEWFRTDMNHNEVGLRGHYILITMGSMGNMIGEGLLDHLNSMSSFDLTSYNFCVYT